MVVKPPNFCNTLGRPTWWGSGFVPDNSFKGGCLGGGSVKNLGGSHVSGKGLGILKAVKERVRQRTPGLQVACRAIRSASLLSSALAVSGAQAAIRIDVAPLFEGKFGANYSPPIRVRIINDGRPISGVVQVNESPFLVPVELPTGVTKELITFPGQQSYLLSATFQGPGVLVRSKEIPLNQAGASQTVLAVGGDSGDLSFLIPRSESRSKGSGNVATSLAEICYVAPEELPRRFSMLMGLSAIVLGEGSERISGESVQALRNWIQLGGNLVILGGPSRSVLSAPGLSELLPVRVGDPTNLRLANDLEVTIRPAQPYLGAREVFNTDGINAFSRAYGLGSVVYVNANLADPIFQTWPGRRSLYQALRTGRFERVNGVLANSQGYGSNVQNYGFKTGTMASSSWSAPPGSGDPYSGSAFSVTLPPTTQVAGLLFLYLIMVLPVNFLILRRLKKLEWAWFTSPVISGIFAFAFVQQGSSLYKAESSNWTQGLIVGASTGQSLVFSGYSQAFFREAGLQDLQLKNVDWLTTPDSYNMSGPTRDRFLDTGIIVAKEVPTRPLEFKQFQYRYVLESQSGATLETLSFTRTSATYRITNRTDQAIENNVLVAFGQVIPVVRINPGESKVLKVDRRAISQKERDSWYRSADTLYSGLAPASSEDRTAFFSGYLIKFSPPLQAGKSLPSSVRIIVSADLGKEFAPREVWR